jgi:hypothetical protein
VSRRKEIDSDRLEWTCSGCPAETLARGGWTLTSATFGHFTGPASDDVILSTYGCLPHAAGPLGDSFLVTRRGGKWRKVSFQMTLATWECRKLRMSDARDALLCDNGDGHQGSDQQWYELVTVDHGGLTQTRLFFLQENVTACQNPVIAQTIDSVELRRLSQSTYKLRVDVDSGKKRVSAKEAGLCHEAEFPRFPRTTYHLVFHFDGRRFRPGPQTAAALKKIESLQDSSML